MEKKTFKNLNNFSLEYVDSLLNYSAPYKTLINDYMGYRIEEVLMMSKIDRLLDRNLITEEVHEYLYKLFEERRKIESIINFSDKDEVANSYYEELSKINAELAKYDVNLNYEELLDSSIDKNIYKDIEPTLSYIKKPKRY